MLPYHNNKTILFVLVSLFYKLVLFAILYIIVTVVFSVEFFIILVSALVIIAFYTVLERKLIASIQRRRGPNVVGFWGIAQAVADGLKLVVKEVIIPIKANRALFIFAPMLTLTLAFSLFSAVPIVSYLPTNIVNSDISVFLIFALSSFGVYGIVLSGWSSNSKYAFFGALRSSAQIISYEVFFSLVILNVILLSQSASLVEVVYKQSQTLWYIIPLFPAAVIFFIAILAETNRTPFDLPEAEAEIVAGYNIEYSSILFALFFLGEYGNIFTFSYLFTIFFIGGWNVPILNFIPFGLGATVKALFIAILFVVVRANVPRYRYDQLISLGWNSLLPLSFGYFLLTVAIYYYSF